MPQTTSSLWKRFAAIAQPYFFPAIPGAGWFTLLLLIMLMVFLFGLLLVCVAGIILAANHFAPILTAKIASGLTPLVTDLFHTRQRAAGRSRPGPSGHSLCRVQAASESPSTGLAAAGRRAAPVPVRHRHQRRVLLYRQLLHQRLGEKKPGYGLSAWSVSISAGFLIGIPIVAFYGYVRDYLSMRWREWMTADFLGTVFPGSPLLRNRNQRRDRQSRPADHGRCPLVHPDFPRLSPDHPRVLMDLISFTGILWSKSVLLVCVVLGYSRPRHPYYRPVSAGGWCGSTSISCATRPISATPWSMCATTANRSPFTRAKRNEEGPGSAARFRQAI